MFFLGCPCWTVNQVQHQVNRRSRVNRVIQENEATGLSSAEWSARSQKQNTGANERALKNGLVMSTCHSYNWKTFNSCTQAWPTWAREGLPLVLAFSPWIEFGSQVDKQSIKEVWVYWKLLIYREIPELQEEFHDDWWARSFLVSKKEAQCHKTTQPPKDSTKRRGNVRKPQSVGMAHLYLNMLLRRFIGPSRGIPDLWDPDLQALTSSRALAARAVTSCWLHVGTQEEPRSAGGQRLRVWLVIVFLHMHLKEETVNLLEIRISWWVLAMLKHPRSFKQDSNGNKLQLATFATSRLACHTEHFYGKLPIYTCIKADNKNNGSIWASRQLVHSLNANFPKKSLSIHWLTLTNQ